MLESSVNYPGILRILCIAEMFALLTSCGGGGSTPQPTSNPTPPPNSYTLPGGVPLILVSIPAGTFTMGSPDSEQDRASKEGPQHQVTISQSFQMGKYVITQSQWQAVMGSDMDPSRSQIGSTNPVDSAFYSQVTRSDTLGFLFQLNALTSTTRPPGKVFRLPTEAEWEYAARAGTTTRFYWGDDLSYSAIGSYAWYQGNARGHTNPVGQKLPNAWGLYDMCGNVWEWCQDYYGSYGSSPQTDPVGPTSGTYRIIRGGSWSFTPLINRSAYRGISTAGNFDIGFRVVLAPPRTP